MTVPSAAFKTDVEHDAGMPQGRTASDRQLTVIGPTAAWPLTDWGELWAFRDVLYRLVWRDVKVRYKQTILGAAWAILQPTLLMIVFTLFFARMARVPTGDVPYPVFVFAGLLPWTFFSTAVSQAAQSVISSERLITKVYFPRIFIPLAAIGVALIDCLCASGMLVVLMLWYGIVPGPGLLLIVPIMLVIALVAMGVGTLLAALNVAYRDFRYVVPFLLQFWMFATPTVYMDPTANGVGSFDVVLVANPLSPLIAAFRAAAIGEAQLTGGVLLAAGLAIVVLFAGCFYFRHVEDSFADNI